MTAQTPIKCFRYLAGAFFVQDYADRVHLFATAASDDVARSISKGLADQHGRPVLNWDDEFAEPTNTEERPQETVKRFARELEERDARLQHVREMVKTQGSSGNWNYNSYMRGMFNGLELALATMEGRSPEYLDAPVSYLEQQQSEVDSPKEA